MANTSALREVFEWVREQLAVDYSQPFGKQDARLTTGGARTFNAVSADKRIVATIMNSSGATSGGKKPVGKIRGALAELYYLRLVDADTRLLVLTNPAFYEYVKVAVEGALPRELEIMHLPLPTELERQVAAVTSSASVEMGG